MRWYLALAFIGCGDTEMAPLDAPIASSLSDQCKSACAHKSTCFGEIGLHCRPNCEDLYRNTRSEYMTAFMACFTAPFQCRSEQDCIQEAWRAIPRREVDDTYRSACLSRRAECNDYYPDYDCSSAPFTADLVALGVGCFQKECAIVDECVTLTLGGLVALSPLPP